MSPRTISRRTRVVSVIAGALVFAVFLLLKLVGPYTDWLWFRELGQTSVFFTLLEVRVVIFLVAGTIAGGLVFLSLAVAYRSRPMFIPVAVESPIARYRSVVESSVRLFGFGLPVVVGVLAGYLAQNDWPIVELFLHGTSFGVQDKQFHHDISFYVFDLPFYVLVLDVLDVIVVVCFAVNLLTHYLFDGIRPSRGRGALTKAARVQLASIAGVFFLLKAVGYWFDQYLLLFSSRREPLLSGAGYTDITAVLPAKLILTAIAMICAAAFFAAIVLRDLRVPALATALMILSSVLIGMAWPATVQWVTATPNAQQVEREYIARHIEATKQAFNLSDEYVKTADWAAPNDPDVFAKSVQNDTATLSNLRVLDPNLLAPTFTQRKQDKWFYGFPSQLAIDRYQVDGKLGDYIVAVRELATANLRDDQTNWQNRHLVYTHGNGFVAAPANQVDKQPDANPQGQDAAVQQGGMPVFTVSDLSNYADPASPTPPPLRVQEPRVYYGQLIAATDQDYSIVGGPAQEYDADGVWYSYRGKGGVPVGSLVDRLAFTVKYHELNFLRSDQITDSSRLLFVRDPRERVAKLAPWLTLDEKTYPALVDGRIVWIVDGYTTLAQYPYARPVSLRDAALDSLDAGGDAASRREQLADQVSYIRSSVKATVDAYDGTVTLYQQDDKDPVLKAWMGVFPGLVKPKAEVSPQLAAHFRYPEDLFKVQRNLLARYHVDDPIVFFNGSQLWSVPLQPPGVDQISGQVNQPPYYMLAADPDPARKGQASFQLTTVMTVRSRDYLAADVSVASDPEDYGKITVKQVPSNTQVLGPRNVFDTLKSADQVSQKLGQMQNSVDIKFGNLLTVPVGDGGLLYLEPIYTQAKGQDSAFPKLNKVLVYLNGKIGFQSTVADALKQLGIDVAPGAVAQPAEPPSDESLNPEQSSPNQQQPPSLSRQEAQARLQALGKALADSSKTLGAAQGGVESAKDELDKAQKGGDFAALGKALADQQKAVADYQKAVGDYQKAVADYQRGAADLVNAPN